MFKASVKVWGACGLNLTVSGTRAQRCKLLRSGLGFKVEPGKAQGSSLKAL